MDLQIDFCAMDILLTGTTDWTLSSLEIFKDKCISEVRKNTTLWEPENNEKSMLTLVLESSCPGECSFHGDCLKGECQCEAGWIGDDCSIDMSRPPQVLGLPKKGLCDIRNRKCDRTLVYGKRFARSESLTCKFEQVYVGNGTTVREAPTTILSTKAYFRHSDEIVCSLPSNVTLGTNEEGFPVGYFLSVSNYNAMFSQDLLFLPYHSEEFICSIIGMDASCEKIKVGSGHSTTDGMDVGGDQKEDEKEPKSGSPIDQTPSFFIVMLICGMKWALA
ncbi:von Willebrand factor D and EGF domain-containing protein-like [Liolophura sinensis]|uniref:von Willebrand factor D and EGF domain-containing protein-like n=1 Tax=Liolophura sinensis TaxID=3198878 RepID=UPI0031593416